MGSLGKTWKLGGRRRTNHRGGLLHRAVRSRSGASVREGAGAWSDMSTLDRVLAADREDPSFDYAAH
jgi:hypothetical protein